jgi:hypothetical protein
MANIAFSTPFTKSFTHTNVNVGTAVIQILPATTNAHDKRVMLIIQNQHATNSVQVIFAATGSAGIALLPNQSISIENYNGPVLAGASGPTTPVHLAYSLV